MTDLSSTDLRRFILESNDIRKEPVVVPEWKDDKGNPLTIYIKQKTADEQDRWEEEMRGKNGGPNMKHARARMVLGCIVDKNDNRVFQDEDLVKLSRKSGAVINRLMDKVLELNRVTNDDLEALAKN